MKLGLYSMQNIWDKQPKDKRKQLGYWAKQIDKTIKNYLLAVRSDKHRDKTYEHLVCRLAKREIASLCTTFPELPPPPDKQDHPLVTVGLADQQAWFTKVDRILNKVSINKDSGNIFESIIRIDDNNNTVVLYGKTYAVTEN